MLPIEAALFNRLPLDLALNSEYRTTPPTRKRKWELQGTRESGRSHSPAPAVLLRSLSKDVGVSIGSLDGKREVDEHDLHAQGLALPLKPFVFVYGHYDDAVGIHSAGKKTKRRATTVPCAEGASLRRPCTCLQ